MKFLTVLVVFLASVGCASSGHHSDSAWITTPQGYKVQYVDQGTVATGRATLDQIYSWHAQAVIRACEELARKGASRNAAVAQAKATPWLLVDNHSFLFGKIYAAGQFIAANGVAEVCMYVQATCPGEAFVPKDAPRWTVRAAYNVPGVWVYGILPDGQWFPATANELGHAMGLPGEY